MDLISQVKMADVMMKFWFCLIPCMLQMKGEYIKRLKA